MTELSFSSIIEDNLMDAGTGVMLYPFSISLFGKKKTYYALKKNEREIWFRSLAASLHYTFSLKEYDIKVQG